MVVRVDLRLGGRATRNHLTDTDIISCYTLIVCTHNFIIRIMWLFILIRVGGRATRNHLTTWLGFDDINIHIMMFCVNSGSYLDTFVW